MKTEENVKFGSFLTQLRHDKCLTQEEYALRCGFDRSYIGALERGEKSATINTLAKLAKGLDIKIKNLFEYE